MRKYIPTELGQQIAHESGLVNLTDRIIQADEIQSDVLDAIINHHPYGPSHDEFLGHILSGVKETDRAAIVRGFSVPESSSWRYGQACAEEGLFEGPKLVPFSEVIDEDRLVLSGLVGLDNVRYRSQCALLARSRYQDYGFDSFVDAAVFVGAYLVGRLAAKKGDMLIENLEGMQVSSGAVNQTVKVSGTFDGDLIMVSEKVITSKGILASHNSFVKFSPVVRNTVHGYHSVEPYITAAMFQHAILEQGLHAGRALVDSLEEAVKTTLEPDGAIGYRVGNFADYGYGDTDYLAENIRTLLTDYEERKYLMDSSVLHGSPYLPQSNTHFEIVNNGDGLLFINRDVVTNEEGKPIEISYENFAGLFSAMLEQARQGLGRTSPMQHIELVRAIGSILEQSV